MRQLAEGDNLWNYEALIESMEFDEILAEASDDDYQGSTYMAVREGRRYGILIFGWGSCGGCDALQAAYGDLKEVTEVRDELYQGVRWFDSIDELLAWAHSPDGAALQWYGTDTVYGSMIAVLDAVKSIEGVL